METRELLKKMRDDRKLTKRDVCNSTGIPYTTYTKYEYGERELGLGSLQKIADFYGVTTDYLLGRENASEDDLTTVIKNSNVQDLEEILIRQYLKLSNDQRESVLEFLRRAIQEEAGRQGITLTKWETVRESARNGNGTQTKSYPTTEGEKADSAPFVNDDL